MIAFIRVSVARRTAGDAPAVEIRQCDRGLGRDIEDPHGQIDRVMDPAGGEAPERDGEIAAQKQGEPDPEQPRRFRVRRRPGRDRVDQHKTDVQHARRGCRVEYPGDFQKQQEEGENGDPHRQQLPNGAKVRRVDRLHQTEQDDAGQIDRVGPDQRQKKVRRRRGEEREGDIFIRGSCPVRARAIKAMGREDRVDQDRRVHQALHGQNAPAAELSDLDQTKQEQLRYQIV